MGVQPIILCGGPGSRLWPASTAGHPKPFIDLVGGRTLFQRTLARFATLPDARRPIIVTGVGHRGHARAQMEAIGGDGVILAEPVGRDSAPALLAAALWIARTAPTAVAVAVASDHHIPDDGAFGAAIVAARAAAEGGQIVTFGVQPTFPATGYGYIRPGDPLSAATTVRRVGRFAEKPSMEQAERLIEEGCLWNSGNFMFRVDVLIAECERHAPEVVESVRRAIAEGRADGDAFLLGPAFLEAPRISIDIGVMERTDRAAVLPIDYAWSDLGAWDQVWASAPHDENGNVISGVSVVRDSRDCLVRAAPGSKIIAVGLRNLAIVAQDDQVLITALDQASDMKATLLALEAVSARRGHFRGPADKAAALAAGPRFEAWLERKALPLWWCYGADHQHGGYHEWLGQDLATGPVDRRTRIQARQTHVFALAGLMDWSGPWRGAVEHGLDYLQARCRRADGLFRATVDPSGAPADETAFLYDQAFVLLAFATSAKAAPDRRSELRERAVSLLEVVRRTYRTLDGGYRADDVSETYLANPIMHLFEAALAWLDVESEPVWNDLARELADLFLDRLYDAEAGRVGEIFDEDWRPFPGPEGRLTEPGHQFEWSWLLERWWRRGGDSRARRAARALFAAGERGVDPETGLVWDAMFDDFSVWRRTSRLWPQTERLKASLLLASTAKGPSSAYFASARSAAEAIEAYLDTDIGGLWRDTPRSSANAPPAQASSLYHIAGAVAVMADARRAGLAVAESAKPQAVPRRVKAATV